MKKILSLFLALLLLLSLAGCQMPQQNSPAAPTNEAVPQIIVPDLIGQSIHTLPESDSYTVEQTQTVVSSQPEGTILGQAPTKETMADLGCTIYVIVSDGSKTAVTEPDITEPERPSVTTPSYTRPTLPEQTDPPIPSQEPLDPLPTDPTDPPQTTPPETQPPATQPPATQPTPTLDRNGSYTSKNDVALYIHLYGRLPNNFITKNQAEDRYGWDGGSLSKYGLCIGGDRFYNNEGRLPGGYTYYECDIDTLYSSKRGAKRLVFTYTGIIYYTSDHYKTFTRLY